jgi:8-oxo-dGTP diphosphatase
MEDRKNYRVACDIFVTKSHQLLLGLRKNIYGAGTWAVPGGHLEYGETTYDGAKRELLEETGITTDLELVLTAAGNSVGQAQYVHLGFWLKDPDQEPQLMEPESCEKWQYFDIFSLPENLFDQQKTLIDQFVKVFSK